MALPFTYNLRNLAVRRGASLFTVFGIACVVAVLAVMLALAAGFQNAVASTGDSRNALILRDGATTEIESAIDRGAVDTIRSLPVIPRSAEGMRLAAAEMVLVLNHPKRGGGSTNVTLRGLTEASTFVRPELEMVEGRLFAPGTAEIVIGRQLAARLEGSEVGSTIKQAGREWKIVGIFGTAGSAFESEIWGDAEILLSALNRRIFQSLTVRFPTPEGIEALRAELGRDPRFKTLQVLREDEYYAAQSASLTLFMKTLGIFISVVMAIGALFGALNTMYASVAQRTREIGTLRAIGFGPVAIFLSFLGESVVLGLAGAILGCLLALPVNGIATGTTNWATFSEVAFTFQITAGVLGTGIVFGIAMGVIGGALPALRAARLPIVEALRPR